MIREMMLELLRAVRFDTDRLCLAGDVEVDERQLQLLQPPRTAEQRAVDLQLRPMNGAVALGDVPQVAAMGFEFFQPVRLCVVAIGATAYLQLAVLALERNLGLIFRPATARDGRVTFDTLPRARDGCEAQIEVARFGRQIAQRSHGNTVRHKDTAAAGSDAAECLASSVQATLHTAASIPLATQKLSQRT
jgi:hypothetical protein